MTATVEPVEPLEPVGAAEAVDVVPPRTLLAAGVAWLRRAEPVDLVLRFSLVAVVVTSHHQQVLMAVCAAVAVVLLGRRALLHHPAPWLVGGAALLLWQLPRWYRFDNHVWLTTYWVLAVGLALTTSQRQRALRVDGRLLVGLTFALAAAWKLGSTDFRTGDFFHHSLLLDDRFGFVAERVGGLDASSAAENDVAVQQLVLRPEEPVELYSTSGLRRVAQVFTWWGAAVEVLIAITWLAPLRGRWRALRHLSLLAFVATTYLVVPVGGFGCLLMAMGLTQESDARWVRPAYAAAFAALLVYGPAWQVAFGP